MDADVAYTLTNRRSTCGIWAEMGCLPVELVWGLFLPGSGRESGLSIASDSDPGGYSVPWIGDGFSEAVGQNRCPG